MRAIGMCYFIHACLILFHWTHVHMLVIFFGMIFCLFNKYFYFESVVLAVVFAVVVFFCSDCKNNNAFCSSNCMADILMQRSAQWTMCQYDAFLLRRIFIIFRHLNSGSDISHVLHSTSSVSITTDGMTLVNYADLCIFVDFEYIFLEFVCWLPSLRNVKGDTPHTHTFEITVSFLILSIEKRSTKMYFIQ